MNIRVLTTSDELRQVHDLELEIWGTESAEDRVGVLMLLVATRIGGLVVGAFDEGRLAGFAFAMPAVRDGRPYEWSHMTGVRPEYRNAGLGFRLKVEQRRQAMAAGLDRIAWTYDPLQAVNAHLNVAKLGVVAREYHLDAYPGSASPLHAGTATDRLVADWRIRSDRVAAHLTAVERHEPPPREHGTVVPVNRVRAGGQPLAPGGHDLTLDAPLLGVTIPTGFADMQQRDLPLARSWRDATREIFTSYLPRGYVVSDFVLDRPACRGTYVLSRP
jgi:predicted GNAT superfamily acetyltransferase